MRRSTLIAIRIIDALVKRDAALRAGMPAPTPSNIIHVQTMHASRAFSRERKGSTVTMNFRRNDPDLQRLVNEIKNSIAGIDLSQSAKGQLAADIGTVEAHRTSGGVVARAEKTVMESCSMEFRFGGDRLS